ncbi:MAG: hypothetical protein CMA27_00680 [Euryarchaeota archaeon]|nr:hypothetical protein [Euryarchaeota archaeon]|tara:strand:+ start:201 stop:2567 length:2367 start_codon:yes stop_codon:yes gene_type:complete
MGRQFWVVLTIIALFITPTIPQHLDSEFDNKNTNARSSFECSEYTYSLNQSFDLDAAFSVNDDDCVALILQGNNGDEVLNFIISGNSSYAIDSLVMDSGVYYSYLNEQKYHINPLSGSYLIENNPSIENLTGDVEFTWSIPSSDDFVIVLDNMRHPADEGRGAGGGNSVSIAIEISYNNDPWIWKPFESIVQLENNLENVILNNQPFYFDEGDVITLESNQLFGTGEACFIEENSGLSNCDSVNSKLEISGVNDNQFNWNVTTEHTNLPLNLLVVNKGNSKMASTLKMLVNPILNPIIDILSHNSTEILLEDSLELDASNTPNRWSQIDSISWDIQGIGIIEGLNANAKWDSPGEYSVMLEIIRIDGETKSKSISITVIDNINPILKVTGITEGAFIEQNSILTLTCDCFDNHEIETIDWFLDSNLDLNIDGDDFVFEVTTTELGSHNLTVRIKDMSGNIVSSSIVFTIVDATSPELISVTWPEDNLVQNTPLKFGIKANDPEDSNLIYRWDIDLSTDSDNDGNKRNDWILGAYDTSTNEAVMSYSYSSPGVYTVMVQVVNSENRKLELTHSVAVSQAIAPETSSKIYLFGGLILLAILAGLGYVGWNNIQQRISQIESEGKNLTPEEQAELQRQELSQELYGNEQHDLANVANVGNTEQQWSRPQTQQINYHQMAGIPQQNQQPMNNNLGNDMLDALIEEDDPKPEASKEIDDDLSFLNEMKQSNNHEKGVEKKLDGNQKKSTGMKMEIPGMDSISKPSGQKKGSLKIDLPPLPEKLNKNDDGDIDI